MISEPCHNPDIIVFFVFLSQLWWRTIFILCANTKAAISDTSPCMCKLAPLASDHTAVTKRSVVPRTAVRLSPSAFFQTIPSITWKYSKLPFSKTKLVSTTPLHALNRSFSVNNTLQFVLIISNSPLTSFMIVTYSSSLKPLKSSTTVKTAPSSAKYCNVWFVRSAMAVSTSQPSLYKSPRMSKLFRALSVKISYTLPAISFFIMLSSSG